MVRYRAHIAWVGPPEFRFFCRDHILTIEIRTLFSDD